MAGKVNPIPQGFRTITPHLAVNDGMGAIEFYKKAFGAEGELCMPGPDGKTVMHAELKIGDSIVMLASEFPGSGISAPKTINGTSVCVHLYVEDTDAAYARAIDAGAAPVMPPADMFWGDRYAKVTDPFGHSWAIATHIEDVSPEEMAARAEKWMGGMSCDKS